VGKDLFGDEWI